MAIKADIVTVGTTATLIAAAGPTVQDKSTVLINTFSGEMFLGGPDVDDTDGFPVDDTSTGIALELGPGDALYGIVAAGTETVNVLRTRA